MNASTPATTVPFNDLSRSARSLWEHASSRWEHAIHSGWVVLGDAVRDFESSFANYLGGGHVVGVASGTDALELGMRAIGVTRGATVALAANAGFYSSAALLSIGAELIYIDVGEGQVTPGLDEVRTCLDATHVDAVVITHLYGGAAPEIVAVADLCSARGVKLVEDCSQSHGASLDGTMTGGFGDVAAFSFYPTKNLGALGDAGAVYTRSDDVAGLARSLRQYGWSTKYHVHNEGGRNSRLDELQATVLLASLEDLDRRNRRRRSIVRRYCAASPTAQFLAVARGDESWVGHLCVVAVDDRDAIRKRFAEIGIATDIHFPVADHQQAVWHDQRTEVLPRTEALAAHVLSLPCFPEMTEEEVERVADAIAGVFS